MLFLNVKIFLRCKNTGQYVGKKGDSVRLLQEAREFGDVAEVENYSRQHGIKGSAVVSLHNLTYELPLKCDEAA